MADPLDRCAWLELENHRLSMSRMAWVDQAHRFRDERDQEREHVRLLKQTVEELQQAIHDIKANYAAEERIGS